MDCTSPGPSLSINEVRVAVEFRREGEVWPPRLYWKLESTRTDVASFANISTSVQYQGFRCPAQVQRIHTEGHHIVMRLGGIGEALGEWR